MTRPFRRNLVAGAVGIFLATAASAETLTDTLVATYKSSGLIDQNRAVLRAADEDAAQAVAALRPVFSYIASSTYVDNVQGSSTTTSLGLNGDMLLYDFGRSQLSIDAAKETVLATRAALVDVENGVLFSAVSAFQSVRLAQASVELRENNVRLLNEQLRATRDRFEVGDGSEHTR